MARSDLDLSLDGLDADDPDDDLERLLRTVLGLALELLHRKHRFFPFGAVVWEDGEVQLAAAPTRAEDGAKLRAQDELLAALEAELRSDIGGGRARAVALCTCGPGLVSCHLERIDGTAVGAALAFRTRFPRRLDVDDDVAEVDATPRLFGPR